MNSVCENIGVMNNLAYLFENNATEAMRNPEDRSLVGLTKVSKALTAKEPSYLSSLPPK